MTQGEDKLKSCPFDCGGRLTDLEVETHSSDYHFVICEYCGARGEACGTKEQAIKAWNTRTPELDEGAVRHFVEHEYFPRIAANGRLDPDELVNLMMKTFGAKPQPEIDTAVMAEILKELRIHGWSPEGLAKQLSERRSEWLKED